MGRAPCCEKDAVKRGPWTPEEDAKLLACIGQYGTGSWRTLPKKAGLQRCGKSCRLRWTNYLRPDLKHGRFSDQEEQLIVKLHAALGSRWSLIAAQLPGRTDNDVKNYWNTRLKKKLCEMGIDPITHKPISQLLADLAGSMTLPKGSEIAEATLGCFKDDMLNVLMRKRSDAAPLFHPHINMSFAPLTLPPNPAPPAPNHPANTPPPSPALTNLDHSSCPLLLLHDNSFPLKPSPFPSGPVSGIRSLSSRSIPAINPSLVLSDHSHKLHLDHPLSSITFPSSSPNPDILPSFPPHLSPLYSHHTGSLNDPSSMLDLLLDQTGFNAAQMKDVPDLNLMNDQQLQAMRSRCTGLGPESRGKSVGTSDHGSWANHASVGGDGEVLPEQAGNPQRRSVYRALLHRKEKEGRGMNRREKPGKDQQRARMDADSEQSMRGASMMMMPREGEVGDQNIRTLGCHMMQEWSPVSYTNSGSSSSNLSLSAAHHSTISPLDGVLNSDSTLLWDLSELGSMVT